MIIILIIGMVFTGIICAFLFFEGKHSIQSEYLVSQRYGEASLLNAVQLADQSFSFYDNVYNPPLRLGLLRFRNYYNQSQGLTEDLDLYKIRDDISIFFDMPIDLYIFDSSGVIVDATFESDIGLDFSIYPNFNQRLTKIREGDSIEFDAVVTGTRLGEERKYAYIPTPDHRYILEIGIKLDEFFKKEGISKYPRLATWYSKTRDDVLSAWIFDRTALVTSDIRTSVQGFDAYPYEFQEYEGREEYLKQVFREEENLVIEDPDSHTVVKYIYIPQIPSNSVSAGLFDKIVEITYSTTGIKEQETILFYNVLILAIGVILIMVFIAIGISRYIVQPVSQIVEDIEIIANGDYNHRIRQTKGFEFQRIESSIQKMVSSLKEDIISIQQKSDELDNELTHRLSAEKSLRIINYKLSLLSSITRHDIVNKISVVSSGLDLLEEDVPDNGQTSRYFATIRDAVNSIHEMILFTRLYEEMGTNEPVWHNVSQKINEVKKSLNYGQVMIIDKTNNLEIFADPLFDRVVYNLIENALRHGGEISTIEFAAEPGESECLLIVRDDGVGVPGMEKELIFKRGQGKNTGLGLFLAREILSLTDIIITETGKAGQGARFELTLPPGRWRNNDPTAVPDTDDTGDTLGMMK